MTRPATDLLVSSLITFFDIDVLLTCQSLAGHLDPTENPSGSVYRAIVRDPGSIAGLLGPDTALESTLVHCGIGDLPANLDFDKVSPEVTFLLHGHVGETDLPKLRLDSQAYVHHGGNDTHVTLDEVYRVKRGRLVRRPFGTWTKRFGLRIPEPNMWERRNNLGGVVLVDTWMEYAPYTFTDSQGNVVGELLNYSEIIHVYQLCIII